MLKIRKERPAELKPSVKVMIVDDHPLLRQGLRRIIEGEAGMTVCGEAEDAAQALQAAETTTPDLAVVDLCLRGRSGLELVRDLKARWPKLPVLILSMFDECLYAERALRAGASGYVMKQQAADEVIAAIRRILQGHIHLSPALSSRMLRLAVGGGTAGAGEAEPNRSAEQGVRQLSDRELDVFELLGQGLSTRRIAEMLYRSVKTIESHRENIKAKLGVRSGAELLRYAVEHSLHIETAPANCARPADTGARSAADGPGHADAPPEGTGAGPGGEISESRDGDSPHSVPVYA